LRERAIYADLRKYLGDIRIQVEIEIDAQLHGPIVRVEGTHIQHAFNTRHRFFNGRGDGALDGECIRTDIVGCDYDFRRRDRGKLRDGKALGHDDSSNHDQNGDHDRGDGPINEEF
jgi:hypothetical protein